MIEPVYRIQCDGLCEGWLRRLDGLGPASDTLADIMTITAVEDRAAVFLDQRKAQMAAVAQGWRPVQGHGLEGDWLCPTCQRPRPAQSTGPVRPDEGENA